jgi:hypothetical protein
MSYFHEKILEIVSSGQEPQKTTDAIIKLLEGEGILEAEEEDYGYGWGYEGDPDYLEEEDDTDQKVVFPSTPPVDKKVPR